MVHYREQLVLYTSQIRSLSLHALSKMPENLTVAVEYAMSNDPNVKKVDKHALGRAALPFRWRR